MLSWNKGTWNLRQSCTRLGTIRNFVSIQILISQVSLLPPAMRFCDYRTGMLSWNKGTWNMRRSCTRLGTIRNFVSIRILISRVSEKFALLFNDIYGLGPGPSMPMIGTIGLETALPLKQSDYLKVKFWHRRDWTAFQNRNQVQDESKLVTRGRSRLSKGINVMMSTLNRRMACLWMAMWQITFEIWRKLSGLDWQTRHQ